MIKVLTRASSLCQNGQNGQKCGVVRDKLMGYAKDVSIFLNSGTGVELYLLIFLSLLIICITSLASVSISYGLDG